MDAPGSLPAIEFPDMFAEERAGARSGSKQVGFPKMIEGEARTKRRFNFVLGSCLFLVSLAALALALFPMYVIRPFREQKPAALQHALWVTLHDKAILFGLFLLIAI